MDTKFIRDRITQLRIQKGVSEYKMSYDLGHSRSYMHEALLSFMDMEFCLVILDARISAEDDHKLLKAMRKARTTPILILSSQSCHVERLELLQAGAHAYIGHP